MQVWLSRLSHTSGSSNYPQRRQIISFGSSPPLHARARAEPRGYRNGVLRRRGALLGPAVQTEGCVCRGRRDLEVVSFLRSATCRGPTPAARGLAVSRPPPRVRGVLPRHAQPCRGPAGASHVGDTAQRRRQHRAGRGPFLPNTGGGRRGGNELTTRVVARTHTHDTVGAGSHHTTGTSKVEARGPPPANISPPLPSPPLPSPCLSISQTSSPSCAMRARRSGAWITAATAPTTARRAVHEVSEEGRGSLAPKILPLLPFSLTPPPPLTASLRRRPPGHRVPHLHQEHPLPRR
jgi:hypothetical protein